jgi:ABC-type nitrate/sulfonate/bicarbonate transport system substrate-binding protein
MDDTLKKIFSLICLLMTFFVFSGCSAESSMTIMIPNGSTSISSIFLQTDYEQYEISLVNGPTPLSSAFSSGSHDVIFAPTNLGAKYYAVNIADAIATNDYLFAGTVVWGNYFLATTGAEPFDLPSVAGKNIVVFGQGSTSDIILKYVLAENNISATFTYVDGVTDATALFRADESLIILTAEPFLSFLEVDVLDLQTIDLQEEYGEITGASSYPQAGIFIKSTLEKTQIDTFLTNMDASVAKVNANPAEAVLAGVSLNLGFPEAVLLHAIPQSHLDFVSAMASKPALEAYFTTILSYNGNLIGNKLPEASFYYLP